MRRNLISFRVLPSILALGLITSTYAADACTDDMGHKGSGHAVSGNRTGSIGGTNWGFEQWAQGGNNSMTYYDNGTFKASWNNSGDYLARVGFRYGDNGSGVDHKTKHYAVDYKYTNQGSASYGYIGVYGWTVNPQTEYYIVDDWYSKPNEAYIGPKFGEIEVDGAKYTIHAFLRDNEPSKTGNSTFVQFFSVRETPRKCGHIDISAHFNKWDELFHGQTATLPTSKKGKKNATLKFGRVTEVMLMNEAGGSATGSIDYTYFNMVDNATSTVTPKSSSSVAPKSSSSAKSGGTTSAKIDACKDEMGHVGSGTTTKGKDGSSEMRDIGNTGYHYEIWYQGGNNSMTFYDNGTYKANWSYTNDFIARVGLKYNEDKTYEELSPIDAYFRWNKSGNAGGYNYIGIYGWTVDPLVEYYIVDDWFNKPGSNLTGQYKGEFEVDGDVYQIYQNTRYNAPSIKGTKTFPQFFSVRKNGRSCGHIDVTAHFKKWESLGMKLGKLYEAKVLVEAGGGSGSFDVSYFKMTDVNSAPPPIPSSSSEEKNASSSSHHHHHGWGSSSSTESLLTVAPGPRLMTGSFQVFDMQGRMMGMVDLNGSVDLEQVLKARFQRLGVYLVKQGAKLYKVQVKY